MSESNFPNKKYLSDLANQMKNKADEQQDVVDKILTNSGIGMNWIADYVTDETVSWTKEKLSMNSLWLTGTNPALNKIVIQTCERAPGKLREVLISDESVKELFSKFQYSDIPILVRLDDEKYKVLDGMKRVLAAIRDNKEEITAFVARQRGAPKPKCEPHVVYDLIRAYHRGINKDKEGLKTSLRFLKLSYANVEELLKNRFNKNWIPDDEIQGIIKEVLSS